LIQPIRGVQLLAAVDAILVDSLDGRHEKAPAVGQHQAVVAEFHALCRGDFSGFRVDRRRRLIENQLDALRTVVLPTIAEDGVTGYIAADEIGQRAGILLDRYVAAAVIKPQHAQSGALGA